MVLLKNSNFVGPQNESILMVACSIGAILSMIFAVLGIKLKWFKHRLNFENGSSASSSSQITAPVATQGVFRRRLDADIYFENESPKSLPPVRIRKQSKPVNLPVPPQKTHRNPSSRDTPELPSSPPPYQANKNDNENDFIIISRKRSEPQPIVHQTVSSFTVTNEHNIKNGKQSHKQPKSPTEVVSKSRRAIEQNKERKPRSKSQSPIPSEIRNVPKGSKDLDQNDKKGGKSKSLNPLANKKPKSVAPLPTENEQSLSKDKKSKEGFSKKLTFHFGSGKPKSKDKKEKENEISKRRPTGYVRPPKQDVDQLEASVTANNIKLVDGKTVLHLDGVTNDSDYDEVFENVKQKPKPTVENVPIPTVKIEDEDEDDTWSRVAQRRNLTQEIKRQNALIRTKTSEQLNSIDQEEPRQFINPLANPKPRNMRDMKKTQDKKKENEKNSINLGGDNSFDTEA